MVCESSSLVCCVMVLSREVSTAPTIHINHLPRNVGGIKHEKTHGTCNVVRGSGALQQGVLHDRLPFVIRKLAIVRPQYWPRGHGIHPHLGGHLNGQRPG